MDDELISCWRDGWHIGPEFKVTRDDWNCDDHYWNCDCPTIEADPDIAGIGVIAAFVASASLTLTATILCLLLSRRATVPTYNPLDKFFRSKLCDPLQRYVGRDRANKLARVLYDMVICLSDQQLVTGIALFVAAFKKLSDASITVYHFNIVTDLAWFSSNTHLTALLVVRSFETSVKPELYQPAAPGQRQFKAKIPTLLRALLMCTLAVMLLYATNISAYVDWYDVDDCPATCVIGLEKGGLPLQWASANFFLIIWAYSLAIFMLWRRGRKYWLDRWRPHIVDKRSLGESHQAVKWLDGFKYPWKLPRTIYLPLWYFLSSETEGLLESILWHVLGYYWLFEDRESGHQLMSQEEEEAENGLGFGQLVPIFLLVLPVVQFFESLAARFAPDTEIPAPDNEQAPAIPEQKRANTNWF